MTTEITPLAARRSKGRERAAGRATRVRPCATKWYANSPPAIPIRCPPITLRPVASPCPLMTSEYAVGPRLGKINDRPVSQAIKAGRPRRRPTSILKRIILGTDALPHLCYEALFPPERVLERTAKGPHSNDTARQCSHCSTPRGCPHHIPSAVHSYPILRSLPNTGRGWQPAGRPSLKAIWEPLISRVAP